MKFVLLIILSLAVVLGGCELRFGAQPTPTAEPSMPAPPPAVVVVWVQDGDLYAWREDDPTARVIASGAVIEPHLSPSGRLVAFTRGAQGDARALWVVGIDGTGERELVAPDVIPSIRNGHPQIDQVEWLGEEAVYFGTRQDYENGSVRDDNLYRAALDADPQLILPAGAGGAFAISPDGQQIAVVSAGQYDTVEGQVTLLDPLGVQVSEKLSFTALRAPNEPPFYPPLVWNVEGDFVRVPVSSRGSERVALWRVPVEGEAQIFGYITALPDGLPVWGGARMVYIQANENERLVLILSDASGANGQVYATGVIAKPRWLPDAQHFAYELDGGLWLGRPGAAPRLLLDQAPEQVVFLADGTFVYAAAGALLRGHIDGGVEEVVANVEGGAAFDAAMNP